AFAVVPLASSGNRLLRFLAVGVKPSYYAINPFTLSASGGDRSMRLLTAGVTRSEYAVDPVRRLLREPDSLLESVVAGMRRLKPGMHQVEVDRLLHLQSLEWFLTHGSPGFGFTSEFR